MYRMIIVEDETLIRKWLRYGLHYEEIGIQVVGDAPNGAIGAQLIIEERPDIVLTDITMPEKTAFEMFEATEMVPYVKVILSGYSDFENAKRAMQYGVVDFITKPIDSNELMQTLESIVHGLRQEPVVNLPEAAATLASVSRSTLDDCTREVVEWIEQHYDSDATVAEIARELGFSESYLYRQFKQQMHQTMNQFKTEVRLKKALEMMQATPHLHLYQIAQQVGWSDYNYFNQLFKKYIGVTATELKRDLETAKK